MSLMFAILVPCLYQAQRFHFSIGNSFMNNAYYVQNADAKRNL